MKQAAKITEFFERASGVFFELTVSGNRIATNKTANNGDKEEALNYLQSFFEYVPENAKIQISVANGSNMASSVTLVTYNNESGKYEVPTSKQSGFGGNESSYQQGFNQGYNMGVSAGRMEAKSEYMLEKFAELQEGGNKSGVDLQSLAVNLSSSEKGHEILHAIVKKFGLLEQ